jgi:hypothetical protein
LVPVEEEVGADIRHLIHPVMREGEEEVAVGEFQK